ncbi:hypothetical protein NDU88_002315 [Pleurodeles waltl]|uniref:Uncharacterized protein n=1 Tax=Pleurodeles waltl TaxID=8319 RepID=A0AAV7U9B8_PLEWA|nr:hypothetical protein NDU88_002315 [Pleurodeles waltl]
MRGFFSPRGVLHMQRYCRAGTLTSHPDPCSPPGAQGSTPGSSSGPPLRTDSSGIRIRVRLQFSLLPISWAQSFFTGPRLRRVREFFLVSSPRGFKSRRTSDYSLGSPLFILVGMEQFPPVVGTLGGQSHPARARSVTLVPGLKVGRQAAGSSHLYHFQRAPSDAEGSTSGSPTGQLLPNSSGSVDGP